MEESAKYERDVNRLNDESKLIKQSSRKIATELCKYFPKLEIVRYVNSKDPIKISVNRLLKNSKEEQT